MRQLKGFGTVGRRHELQEDGARIVDVERALAELEGEDERRGGERQGGRRRRAGLCSRGRSAFGTQRRGYRVGEVK